MRRKSYYTTDYLGRKVKVVTDKWGYEHQKILRPHEWFWPIRDIMNFILYCRFIKHCDPEEIGFLRSRIAKYGFNRGIHLFEGWLRSKRTSEYYEAKGALEDMAQGKLPGQGQKEYVEAVEASWKLQDERKRKKELIREYQKLVKDSQLDNVSEQDLRDAINKLKRKP